MRWSNLMHLWLKSIKLWCFWLARLRKINYDALTLVVCRQASVAAALCSQRGTTYCCRYWASFFFALWRALCACNGALLPSVERARIYKYISRLYFIYHKRIMSNAYGTIKIKSPNHHRNKSKKIKKNRLDFLWFFIGETIKFSIFQAQVCAEI